MYLALFVVTLHLLLLVGVYGREIIELHREVNLQSGDADSGIPYSEYSALYDFYVSTNGWFWYDYGLVPWNFTVYEDPCTSRWEGITCSYNATGGSSHVIALDLELYGLFGPIPGSIGNFTMLQRLNLTQNILTGTVPETITLLTQLKYLTLYINALSGPIPNSIGNLAALAYLDLAGNGFTSSIPVSFGGLTSLKTVFLNANALSGSIPASIGNILGLEELVLYGNYLSQSLPESVGQLAQLRSLDCFVNALTGTIPASFGNLINLRFLDLSINQMHGSIPDTLSGMVSMTYLHVADNAFTGTVPQSISVMTNLSTLHLSNNMFKGTLPAAIATFQQLRFVLVEKNFLSGQISSFVDSTQQSALLTLLLAGNRFTGSLPADVFHLPSLQSVHCDNNCLSGSLPDSICDNPGLRLLSLNGMHTSKACRHSLFPGLSSVYDLPAGTISGSIPTCLYELPLLELLDLSSNGLSGSLPHEVNFGALLMNLSASHNNLKGELPAVFQERAWRRLDLSYNRITGALEDTFAVQTRASSLQLRNNRLSGNIPSQLVNATDIAILPGNTFACDVRKRELPANDPAKLTYQCGTSTFDGAYYTWMAMAFALLVGISCFYWVRKKEIQVVDTFLSIVYRVRTLLDIRDLKDSHGVSYKHRMRRYKKISDMCELCVKLSNYVSLVIVFVLLPVYTGMSAYYNTYTYQYAYNVSLIYQSGKVPAAICMTLLFSYACFVVLLRSFQRQCALFEREINYDASAVEFRESASVKEDVFTTEKALVYMGCVVVDLVVVFAANISFVLVVLKGDEVFLFLAQGALSVFKILWGSVCSSVVYYLAVHTKFKSHNLKKGMLFVLFFVTIFNNIVVPCLVIMAISTTCFYNIAEQSPPVNSDFYVVDCAGVSESKCTSDSYVIASTPINFNPPFTYSYQCSASFVTAYAPSFVYMCIVSGFMIPAARYLSQVIAPRLTPGTIWYKLIYPHIPKLLRPITAESPVASRYFDSRKMIVSLLNNLGVMMTFGAVFPPLAIAVLMTTFCRVFFSRLEIKRFLRAAAKLDRVDMIERIDADCAGVGSDSMLIRSMWTLLTLSCWFYALFLFDTLGDDTGLDGAYWVLIVMLLLPIVLRAAFVCYTGTYLVRTRERLVSSVSSQSATTLEMIIKLQQEVRSPMSTTAEVQEGVGDESL